METLKSRLLGSHTNLYFVNKKFEPFAPTSSKDVIGDKGSNDSDEKLGRSPNVVDAVDSGEGADTAFMQPMLPVSDNVNISGGAHMAFEEMADWVDKLDAKLHGGDLEADNIEV